MTRPPVHADVGQRLAAARARRQVSQGTVARLAGLAPSYLSRIETSKVHPTFATVQRVAAALDISLEELAGPKRRTRDRKGVCPVSEGGRCLLDLIHADAVRARRQGIEAFSPRQVRLLRSFAAWLQQAPSDLQGAMGVLLDTLTRSR